MNNRRLSRQVRIIMLFASAALFVPIGRTQERVCTLADHIRSANTNTSVGSCPRGTSHDIITITEDITLTEPLPWIRGTITIEGGGHTISGNKEHPIFVVNGGRLTINNLTLTKGNDSATANNAWTFGGALWVLHGAQAQVNESIFIDNASDRHGGAINVARSRLTVDNSSFVKNRASGNGGAINFFESTGDIRNSSFVGNRTRLVQTGGAIGVGKGVTLNVSNSTFYDNYAGKGGAIATHRSPLDASVNSSTTLTHVTMVDNRSAGEQGRNIWVDENDVNFKLRNSLIIGKKGEYRKFGSSCHGPLRENVGNFIEDGSCASMEGGDPLLGELTGAPAYFPLLDGSPALDAADARYCAETDQLGTARPQGAGCDIGAIESTTAIPIPTPAPGICPLPDQIIAANTDRAVGNCAAGNGADVIYMIRDFKLEAKLPPITSDITLEGNGYTISGEYAFGIFEVDGGSLTIRDVTLIRGNASRGGAISLKNGGIAHVVDVTFWENSAFFGGAISTESVGDRLTVRNSRFVDNRAETSGGAISADGGLIEVSSSAFQDNQAVETGGAIAALRGRLTMTNSTLSGNAALKGGGIHVGGGEATLNHLTLMNNVAERVTGAGIYREAGAVFLLNSIVAGSGSGDDCSGRLAQSRGNFSEDGRCASEIGGDPLLADMVRSPAHYPLLDNSRAHGRADKAVCLATDQLGNERPNCDIGAIESARDPDIEAAPKYAPPEDCTLADQIRAANLDEPVGGCPAGNGADVIRLRQNITLDEPLPTISSDITIDGYGHSISGARRFRVLDIESGDVVLKHIALIDGRNPDGDGGTVTLRGGAKLLVVDASFRGSKARNGGGVASIGGSAIYLYESSFLDNEASSRGGALWRSGRCGYFSDIEFRRNKAGELKGTIMDDYLTHIDGSARTCTNDPEVYRLSDT